MKIFLVEDRAEEQDKALSAVKAAGHELVPQQQGIFYQLREWSQANDGRTRFEIYTNRTRRALSQAEGIITDLMFHASPFSEGPTPPTGLLVVMSAIKAGLPVVVCTNAAEVGGHHAEALSWIFDGYVSTFEKWWEGGAPFGWVEDKDWTKAVSLLERMMSKKAEADRGAR